MTIVDIISFMGGILGTVEAILIRVFFCELIFPGLFAGFSFISSFECIYILSMKFFCIDKIPDLDVSLRNNKVRPFEDSSGEKTLNTVKNYILLYMKESSIHSFKFISLSRKNIER
jgi:hypothetical protein